MTAVTPSATSVRPPALTLRPLIVADWMTPDPVTVEPTTTLLEIRALCRRHGFHHVPVVENGRTVGVVSDRDVLAATSPFLDTLGETHRDLVTLTRPAAVLMSAPPRGIAPDAPLADAARQMAEGNVSSLLVTDADGTLVGILTAQDVLRSTAGL